MGITLSNRGVRVVWDALYIDRCLAIWMHILLPRIVGSCWCGNYISIPEISFLCVWGYPKTWTPNENHLHPSNYSYSLEYKIQSSYENMSNQRSNGPKRLYHQNENKMYIKIQFWQFMSPLTYCLADMIQCLFKRKENQSWTKRKNERHSLRILY